MSGSLGPALADLSYVVLAVVGLYATYWAFAIRRRLMGRIYRNHALWLGVLGIVVAVPSSFSSLTSNNLLTNTLVTFYDNAPWQVVVVFAFIDSLIPVLRRSDALLRNILHWKKLRIAVWSFLTLTIIVSIYLSIYLPTCFLAADPSACITLAMGNSGWFGIIIGFWGGLAWLITLFVLIPGASALLIGVARSKDAVLRESVKWLGLGLLFVLGLVLVGTVEGPILNLSYYYSTYSYGIVPWNALLILFGYALYRSARSLAPLNRLPLIDAEAPLARQVR